ncbi:MAG: ATP-binding protein [Candidatus Omnitrophica bacterium]|nr:ATP-binding protein [Candidatus Omnitrophota bacterium]MBU4418510.1 ATP-binding protein [Candidatus Omnitrophota bacterium]MBU4468480.1 ATP-binding protein [Candidatus Omnitrophota bacterium]MCG2707507.1 ATP-binding protein [Candidatus Omnitrophota bacterium]
MKIKKRLFELNLPAGKSAFLWGPRKVGKTYWISHSLKNAAVIDLLKTDTLAEYVSRPALLRERYQNHKPGLIVIDEVQKAPRLLDEVHWLIENKGLSFLLTGSSARKLRRGQANLLGGRAWRKTMVPLSFIEVTDFALEKVMISGLLPPHYLSANPVEELRAYVADYLKEEIIAEALIQNIPAFSEFLRVAAITSSELINYVNIARETGVSHKVIRTYFDILEDTYLGFRVPPWKKSKNRRMITTEKFYLFDVGVANYLARRQPLLGSPEFGKSFEHYILMELKAYQAYRNPDMPITFWRTSTGREVDFILGEKELAIEIKGSSRVHEGDIRSLQALIEDGPIKKRCLVCMEKQPRNLTNNIQILPWQMFIEQLWNDELL